MGESTFLGFMCEFVRKLESNLMAPKESLMVQECDTLAENVRRLDIGKCNGTGIGGIAHQQTIHHRHSLSAGNAAVRLERPIIIPEHQPGCHGRGNVSLSPMSFLTSMDVLLGCLSQMRELPGERLRRSSTGSCLRSPGLQRTRFCQWFGS